jgi:MFS family permease
MNDERRHQHILRAGWRIAAIAFFSGIGGGVVFPILPVLGLQLGLSAAVIGLILSANRITRVVCNPFTGMLLDRFGARWPIAAGLFLETLAVLAFSVALHVDAAAAWFLAGRAVWGVGSSLILVGALAAAMMISTRGTRGRLTGRVRTALTLGLPAGMLVGGVVADLTSANAAFLSAAGITLATGVFALLVMPDGRAERAAADAGPRRGAWGALLRNPLLQVVWWANALIFFAVAGVLLATLVVLVHARGINVPGLGSQGSAGVLMTLLMLFRAGASLGTGAWLDRRTSRTALLLPAALVAAAGFVGLDLAHDFVTLALALAAIGLGSGALTIPLLTLLSDSAPNAVQGRAMSLYQAYGDLGGSAGPIVGLQVGTVTGYGPIYLAVAAAFVLAAAPLYWVVVKERALLAAKGE